jgi:hypothetical protein
MTQRREYTHFAPVFRPYSFVLIMGRHFCRAYQKYDRFPNQELPRIQKKKTFFDAQGTLVHRYSCLPNFLSFFKPLPVSPDPCMPPRQLWLEFRAPHENIEPLSTPPNPLHHFYHNSSLLPHKHPFLPKILIRSYQLHRLIRQAQTWVPKTS